MKISSIKCNNQSLSNSKIPFRNYERLPYDKHYGYSKISIARKRRNENTIDWYCKSIPYAYLSPSGKIIPNGNVSFSRFIKWYMRYIRSLSTTPVGFKNFTRYLASRKGK